VTHASGTREVWSMMRAAALLREAGMPPDEIRTIVTTADPELARRYLELHLERLEERLAAQRRSLASVERLLSTSRARSGAPAEAVP
jgi:DNA-binding transcriptional MerR regulator